MIQTEIATYGPGPAATVIATVRRPARLGAIVAAAICGVIAIGGWIVQPGDGQMAGLLGLPAATVLGHRLAGRVVEADRRGAAVVGSGLAIGTVLVTDALVVAALVAEFMADSVGQVAGRDAIELGARLAADLATSIVTALYLYLAGALIVGGPMLALTVPAAMVWAIAVRFLAGRGLAR